MSPVLTGIRRFAVPVVALLAACLAVKSLCFYSLDPTAIGISRNVFMRQPELQDRAGYHLKPPWVVVSVIDTRPTRVCMTSAAHAAYNCKLVEFVPGEWRTFLKTEGFRLYWWANRVSFNFGYREEYRGMKDILRGYAFSAQSYPFIRTQADYGPPVP